MSKNINSMMLKRQSAEKRFRFYGQASLAIALIMLELLVKVGIRKPDLLSTVGSG